MRDVVQGAFGREAGRDDGGVVWLAARPLRTRTARRFASTLDAIDRAGTKVGRFAACLVVGVVASAVMPVSAFAPVGRAYASIEPVVAVPLLPAAVTIPASPVFARSREDREAVRLDGARQEVEAFLRFGSREVPRRVVETIVRAAAATGVDAIYLMALADKESSFRTEVQASTSSASGLFQFIDRTWLDVVRRAGDRHGLAMEADAITLADDRPVVEDDAMRARILDLRRDPYLAAVMAAELLKGDAEQIGLRIGRKLSATEMYLAHFLGLEDAARFIALRDRKRPPQAARMFPAAARANAAIFYDARRRGRRGLSVPEVYARLEAMIDSRVQRYQDVERYALVGGTRG